MEHLYRCSCGNLSNNPVCAECGKDSTEVRLTINEIVKFYQPFMGTYSTLSTAIVRRKVNSYMTANNITIEQNNMRYINGGYAYTYPVWLFTEALELYKKNISTLIRVPPHLR